MLKLRSGRWSESWPWCCGCVVRALRCRTLHFLHVGWKSGRCEQRRLLKAALRWFPGRRRPREEGAQHRRQRAGTPTMPSDSLLGTFPQRSIEGPDACDAAFSQSHGTCAGLRGGLDCLRLTPRLWAVGQSVPVWERVL